MFWFIFLILIAIFIFIISKSAPIEKPKNKINRKQIEYNLSDYPKEYIFSVAGVHLEHYSYPLLNFCKEFDLVTLIPEPQNYYDSDAIKVESSGFHIGYVPSAETLKIHEILSKDYIAYIESKNTVGFITLYVKIIYKI